MWTLSVCIPIYNTDVRTLVDTLCLQIDQINASHIDIILIDDASASSYKTKNQFTHSKVQLIQLAHNIGRSKIRNAFLQYSNATHLLFLDGDSTVANPFFLQNYSNYLTQHQDTSVLVGASLYQVEPPPVTHRLRWTYSTNRESLDFERRSKDAHAGFKTNNFLIQRSLFEQLPFDEELSGYGHEDTIFGLQILEKNIQIRHINNPVWNLKLDTNTEFLLKTDSALSNLLWLQQRYHTPLLLTTNKLLRYFQLANRYLLTRCALWVLSIQTDLYRHILKTGRAPLFLFDLYRLGRLYQLNKDAKRERS
jgi:glycosyltransferase involved in cell wall biosynthesis